MAICMDYIKSGEVLVAPRLDYKYQYLLKCSECEECYCLLEPFIEHCTSHYNREIYVEDNFLLDEEADDDGQNINKSNEKESTYTNDSNTDAEEVYSITPSDGEYESDNEDIAAKDDLLGENMEAEELSDDMDETGWESAKSDNDEVVESDGNASAIFVRKFMASAENVAALVDAYEDQPKLWNNNLSKQIKKPTDRIKCMQHIANELQNEMNLKITIKEVAAVISYLRLICRVKLERDKSNVKYDKAQKYAWLFERLRFLKPFLESHPIAVLATYPQDLMHEQILQLLDIYKKYPHLWNSEIMENRCKNKRAESLGQMIKDIQLEMDIEVDEITLKKYLHSLHTHFSRQKRRDMGILKTKDPRFDYYEHVIFLYNHLGPFKCSACRRLFMSPLKLKAHKYQHDGVLGLNCPQCEKGFKSVDPYIAHVRRHMNDLGVECKECDKRFLRMADLKIHMRGHTGAKPFCCDICGASFRHSQAFNVHKRRHVKQYSHNCQVCSKGCYTMTELKNHMRTHRDIREFVCVICGKAFKTRKTMQQHTFIHEEGRNHMCTLCGKSFKNKIGLGHHLKTHSKNNLLSSLLN